MENKDHLVKKIKHLLRRANAPSRLHHYGPKTYELWQHVFGLFVKSYCQLSYRSAAIFLRQLGFNVASKSTLQRYAARLSLPFWQTLLRSTLGATSCIAAVDGTGLSRTQASHHYIRRIDGYRHKRGFQLMLLVSRNKKVLSLRLRSKSAGETKDVPYLWRRTGKKLTTVLMDKGYDAEWLHQFFASLKVRSIAPVRKGARRGRYRKKLRDNFPEKLYHKRSIVESVIHALKQRFGGHIGSKYMCSARTEMYVRAILYNMSMLLRRLLGQSLEREYIKVTVPPRKLTIQQKPSNKGNHH